MNQSKELRQRRRRLRPAPEVLEDRMVLSAGEGSTFAIMPGSVTTAGQVSSTQVQDRPDPVHVATKDGQHRRRHRHHARHVDRRGLDHVDAQAPDRLGHRCIGSHDPRAALEVRPEGRQGQ